MYYIKIITQLLCLLLLLSCVSSNAPKKSESQPKTEVDTDKSLKIELAIYTKAIIALNNNELEKAEQLFTQMSKLQPDIAGSWANLALINIKNSDFEQAQKHVDIALEKNPKMPQSLNLSGYLALKQGKIKIAKEFYHKAISIKPNYALAQYNLALLYDIYLQDIANAAIHYQLYLDNIEGKDPVTNDWLNSLKATLKGNQ